MNDKYFNGNRMTSYKLRTINPSLQTRGSRTISILLGLVLVFALSCNKDDDVVKKENGKVWLSGGLAYCAEQIHLDNGDTLIVNMEDLITFTSGDRVSVKYKEIGINKICSPGIDCEIIEIRKVE